MDLSIISLLLLQVAATELPPGEAYLVLNTAALIGAAFWLGVQWNTIRTSQREIADLKKKIDLPVVPLAEMKVTIDNIKDNVEQLTESMERLQRSMELRLGKERNDDATTRPSGSD